MNLKLDPILHQAVRTNLMTLLFQSGNGMDFSTLKKTLSLTDGHMSTHLKALTQKNYVEAKKEFVDSKPRTTYQITELGKAAFKRYLDELDRLCSESFSIMRNK